MAFHEVLEFEEHVTTGLNHISHTGKKKLILYIYTTNRREKFFQLGNCNQWSSPGLKFGTTVVLNL
jgi:hypothetical protein